MSRLDRCYSIADLRRAARRRLPRAIFDYIDGGADDELTLRRNSRDFLRYELVPRVLRNVEHADLGTEVLGTRIGFPVVCAPTGASRLFHHEGEAAVARAACEAGTIYSLSSVSTLSIEEVAAASVGPKWFQIYVWRDRAILKDFIARSREAGYRALCLTVDVPVPGNRERDLRNGLTVPPRLVLGTLLDTIRRPRWLWHYLRSPPIAFRNVTGYAGAATDMVSVMEYISRQFDPLVTWDEAAWMIEQWKGPFAIKGILSVEDAQRAVAAGATGIIVSNHGGRQLDHVPAPIEVLPEIVDAVGSRAEVILDGGVRRGTDVIKALALGARACMIGRPYLFGLAAGGEAGVKRALELLRSEIARDLQLLGCNSIAQLDRSYVRRRIQ